MESEQDEDDHVELVPLKFGSLFWVPVWRHLLLETLVGCALCLDSSTVVVGPLENVF